jgi:hypothetical protein
MLRDLKAEEKQYLWNPARWRNSAQHTGRFQMGQFHWDLRKVF